MKFTIFSILLALLFMVGGTPSLTPQATAQSALTTFVVQIENIAPDNALVADGENVPVLLAPGVWLTHTNNRPLFASGFPDYGDGLEALAEDGDPAPLAASLDNDSGNLGSGVFNTPVGSTSPGPLAPGQTYEFTISASPGARLSFATMFVQSNDLFYSPTETGIALFSASGTPVNGDLTSLIRLWDAGTEINERPGIGNNQAPRQGTPNKGPFEGGLVRQVDDNFSYPRVSEVLRFTVRPISTGSASIACTNDASTARYNVTFNATWSANNHPSDFPSNPHFSGLIGATHHDGVTFWQPGGTATAGIESMAETGSKNLLTREIQNSISLEDAEFLLSGGGVSPSPGTTSLIFDISGSHSLVTLVSMIAPSPDWFVGVNNLDLCQNGRWVDARTIDLFAWDAGTDSGLSFTSPNDDTQPRESIFRIAGFPFQASNGQLLPVGTFRFERIDQAATLSVSKVVADLIPNDPADIENSNRIIGDREIAQAINFWVNGETLPGIDEMISDSQIGELIDLWVFGADVFA
jgi:hypothetical protein